MFSPLQVLDVKNNLNKISKHGQTIILDNAITNIEEYLKEQKLITRRPKVYSCGKIIRPKKTYITIEKNSDDTPICLLTDEMQQKLFSCQNEIDNSETYLTAIKAVREQLTDFTFLSYCGSGSFGETWLVKDLSNQILAIKIILKEDNKWEKELNSLKLYRERIKDFKHLVQIYHIGQTDSFLYYTMEAAFSASQEDYIPMTLELLHKKFKFYNQDSINLTKVFLSGISTLHQQGLAHCDIKPSNIIIVDNHFKISDFGMVALKNLPITGGSKGFFPKEELSITGADSDLYAVSMTLYMLFSSDNVYNFPYVDKELLKSPLAKKLNKLINIGCSNTQSKRFSDAKTFITELDSLLFKPKSFLSKILKFK